MVCQLTVYDYYAEDDTYCVVALPLGPSYELVCDSQELLTYPSVHSLHEDDHVASYVHEDPYSMNVEEVVDKNNHDFFVADVLVGLDTRCGAEASSSATASGDGDVAGLSVLNSRM